MATGISCGEYVPNTHPRKAKKKREQLCSRFEFYRQQLTG
jgi:uncharacterized protein YoaH (UPF0181 family)